jgi:Mrp family chromosome partitioning ATPase
MSFRNSITIVSPRPRVGKTLLARLLADFHLHEGRSVAAFDLNVGERTLAQFLPEKTTVATIRDINGQMVLFDRLVADEDITKVIDLGHESFESFFQWHTRSALSRKRGVVRSPWNSVYGDA